MRSSSTVFIATATVHVAATMADAAAAIAHTGTAESSYATDSAASNAIHTCTVTLPLASIITSVSTTTATFPNAIFGSSVVKQYFALRVGGVGQPTP
jgi:hypothetical protein